MKTNRGEASLSLLTLAGLVGLFIPALQDWFVDAGAPCPGDGSLAHPFCTLQGAIDAASDGDTIHVAPGTYVENVMINKNLQVIGTEGDQVTIIDGGQVGRCVTVLGQFGQAPDYTTTVDLQGLTLTNGTAPNGGGLAAYGYYYIMRQSPSAI